MKKLNFAAIVNAGNGKYFATHLTLSRSINLAHALRDYYAANYCSTAAEANSLVDAWNESFKANGSYAFSEEV